MLSAFLKLLRARDAMAAVEFAFVAPVMIVLFSIAAFNELA